MHHPERACDLGMVTNALARVVEGETLTRLRLLHWQPSRNRSATRQPTADETERLHALLLAPVPVDPDAEVAVLPGGDMTLGSLLTTLLELFPVR